MHVMLCSVARAEATPKSAPGALLPVVDVVLQTQLHLEPHVLNSLGHLALLRLVQE